MTNFRVSTLSRHNQILFRAVCARAAFRGCFSGYLVPLLALLLCLPSANSQAQHKHQHGSPTEHDEVNMPGLKGENASAEESAELAILFRRFETLSREVENLANGIRTVTRSSDPQVMAVLVSHATGMIDRVGRNDDPEIRIQSPTLAPFFIHGEEIDSTIEVTDDGLVVMQTSQNPALVSALQTHAAEVTAMAQRGMAAVHEMMMQQGRGH